MSDAPSVLPFIFRMAFLHPLEKYQQQLSIPFQYWHRYVHWMAKSEILKQSAGQVRSSKARAPRAFFFFLPAPPRDTKYSAEDRA